MPIPTECPRCAKKGNTPVTYVGRTARCPACATDFRIPSQGFKVHDPTEGTPARAPSGEHGFRARVRDLGARCPRLWRP